MSFKALQTKSAGHIICGSADEVHRSCHLWLCGRSQTGVSLDLPHNISSLLIFACYLGAPECVIYLLCGEVSNY